MGWPKSMPLRRGGPHPHQPSPRALARHSGEWVAIVDRRIVASGADFRAVLARGREAFPGREPSMLHVPPDEVLLLRADV